MIAMQIFKPVRKSLFIVAGLFVAAAPLAFAQQHGHSHDNRIAVSFPVPLKEHTLANMRDHLQTLAAIQGYLATQDFDRAADIAEKAPGHAARARGAQQGHAGLCRLPCGLPAEVTR